ncbi:hypothetical protein V7S43_014842 [Phytophthora oleae]|uniref:ABC transporter domain-containing protein n=1 Tax=Phytophthora oleae TaxID=2107226 RepID=A0ABD3F228_9STRA
MASTGPEVVYTSSKDMLAHGPMKLHQDIASKIETALGDKFPQMRVRFKHVSLSAELATLTTKDQPDNNARNELPTLTNKMLKAFGSLFSKTNTIRKEILHDVTGSFRPGTITLVVGQPGSGKSALMKLLSGRFPMDKSIALEGDVLHNGFPRDELLKRLPQFVNYVTQTDTHLPTLTVEETIAFAHECCGAELSQYAEAHLTHGSPEENELAVNAARAMYEHFPGVVLQSLGLVECQNTIVGNEMYRGISGGERRRTSTGEMEFGLKYVTFMDEISTGLDSAAAFDIIAAQRSIAKRLHRTVVISLLQPSPEIFSLFDDVLLLNEGRVLYHGPTRSVQSYFESLGLVCPPEKDIADFLCELATPEQTQYETGRPAQTKYPRSAQEYSQLWIQSPLFRQLEGEAEEQEAQNPATAAKFMSEVPEFQQSFASDLWTLIKREMVMIKRNDAFIKGRLTLVVAVGLIFGSLFYQMDLSDMQVAMGVIFAASLFLALGQEANLIVFYQAREVVYKQRAANFYRTSAYVLACSLSQIPLAFVESLLFGSLMYWLGGLVDDVGAFLLFELFLMLVILVFGAVYFLLAVATPNLNIAKPIAMICILSFVLFAGFIIAKDSIPDWLVWLYWVDPVAWTVRGIAVSQYRSSTLDVCVYKGVDYCSTYGMTLGEYSLSLFDVPSDKTWVVYGALFLLISYVVLMVACYFALEYHHYERPENITLPHETKDEDTTAGEYNLLESPRAVGGADSVVVLPISPLAHKTKVPPVTVAFKDLWYTVSVSGGKGQPARDVELLKGITGYATPGSLTALMGSTGAGKTTLMDVIAGRKTAGTIKGEVLLNGFPATDLSARRCTGYCEQTDVHSRASTFREALTFSAFLRQGSDVPDCVKYDTVSECLELLALEDVADHIIRGSSMEKMKRLTIGVEMAAQPSVLFLDEPTSGLDARSAKIIMDGVRRVADSGRTVLCTIHQPSSDVFFLFDRLLLLKRGGETVYFGDPGYEGSSIVEYFQAIPSVPRIPEGYNPATWMLESIGAGVDSHRQVVNSLDENLSVNVDFVEYFNKSVSKTALDNRLNEPGLFLPSLEVEPLVFGDKRAASNATQLRFLLQ